MLQKFEKLYKKILLENIEEHEFIEKRILTDKNFQLFLFDKISKIIKPLTLFKIILIYTGNKFDEIFLKNFKVKIENNFLNESDINVLYIKQNDEYIPLTEYLNNTLYSINDFDYYFSK